MHASRSHMWKQAGQHFGLWMSLPLVEAFRLHCLTLTGSMRLHTALYVSAKVNTPTVWMHVLPSTEHRQADQGEEVQCHSTQPLGYGAVISCITLYLTYICFCWLLLMTFMTLVECHSHISTLIVYTLPWPLLWDLSFGNTDNRHWFPKEYIRTANDLN